MRDIVIVGKDRRLKMHTFTKVNSAKISVLLACLVFLIFANCFGHNLLAFQRANNSPGFLDFGTGQAETPDWGLHNTGNGTHAIKANDLMRSGFNR